MARRPPSAGTLLKRVASHPFDKADPDVVAELAKALWYDSAAPGQVRQVVQVELTRPLHKRRALYALDVFRRFSCVTDEQYRELDQLVAQLRSQAPSPTTPKYRKRGVSRLVTRDSLAQSWGLREDLSAQLPSTLKYQTRHYSATLDKATGFTKK